MYEVPDGCYEQDDGNVSPSQREGCLAAVSVVHQLRQCVPLQCLVAVDLGHALVYLVLRRVVVVWSHINAVSLVSYS